VQKGHSIIKQKKGSVFSCFPTSLHPLILHSFSKSRQILSEVSLFVVGIVVAMLKSGQDKKLGIYLNPFFFIVAGVTKARLEIPPSGRELATSGERGRNT
jgi:hypothetical protein